MATKRATKTEPPKTTAQQLGCLIKSARGIMRKDKGLNGELDRLPMLTWVMFLKFLDDLEQKEQAEARLARKKYRPVIDAPYRWRDWAARKDGITGGELMKFINNDEAARPDGSRGPGLFAYLRSLQGGDGDGRRDVIANVFRGVSNRMISGCLLRDVIHLVDGIHFTSAEEIHTLSHLYESMLQQMRDAAGDSGEFYTPRPVVRFMVEVIDPRLGETILDPACGTAGFLVESYRHLEKQCKTAADFKVLQEKSLCGGEAKPLPFMLAQMNLLLHGLQSPRIVHGNSLAVKLTEIGERDRVDVILTNPPFGGEEEAGIRGNFPADKQTSETALLFLQLIMRKLKRPGLGSGKGGRAAVVVPNGTLYEGGGAQRIRQELLREFNLHMVVRLPKGVFEPYTDIATNLLFFDTSGPTKRVWFYEHPLPSHRAHLKNQSYSATDGIRYDEFRPCLRWQSKRVANEYAWCVSTDDLAASGYDLALTHPKHARISLPTPEAILDSAERYQRRIPICLRRLRKLLAGLDTLSAEPVPLRAVLRQRHDRTAVRAGVRYKRPRVQLHFRGARVRDVVDGSQIGKKHQTVIRTNELIVSRIDARHGAMAIVPGELDGAIATEDFPVFQLDEQAVMAPYLRFVLFQPAMLRVYERFSRGSTNRRRLDVGALLSLKIPLPELDVQAGIANTLKEVEQQTGMLYESLEGLKEEIGHLLAAALHLALDSD